MSPFPCTKFVMFWTRSIYTNQSGWTIPDHMLRAAVKRVIKDDLLDTYQDFLRRWVHWWLYLGGGLRNCHKEGED